MTVALLSGLFLALAHPSDARAVEARLVRFTCEEREAARRAERTWRAPSVVEELAHGWSVEVFDACDHAREFEFLVGGRGVLAACVLDASGSVVGVLRGPADADTCRAFLEGTRSVLATERASHELRYASEGALARIDARIAFGAWDAAEAELEALVVCSTDAPEVLHERRARIALLRGDVERAEQELAHCAPSRPAPSMPNEAARRAWIDAARCAPDDATRADHLERRLALTCALVALAARRTDEARTLLPRVLADVERAPCELDALLRAARTLHESGLDALALDACAALDAATDSAALHRSTESLREHVAIGPASHVH